MEEQGVLTGVAEDSPPAAGPGNSVNPWKVMEHPGMRAEDVWNPHGSGYDPLVSQGFRMAWSMIQANGFFLLIGLIVLASLLPYLMPRLRYVLDHAPWTQLATTQQKLQEPEVMATMEEARRARILRLQEEHRAAAEQWKRDQAAARAAKAAAADGDGDGDDTGAGAGDSGDGVDPASRRRPGFGGDVFALRSFNGMAGFGAGGGGGGYRPAPRRRPGGAGGS